MPIGSYSWSANEKKGNPWLEFLDVMAQCTLT
jgi:hypothetical protein